MKKYILGLLSALMPVMAMADNMSLAPPPTDVSVIFLSNLFGVVDGVLHGTGSQIMGNMFMVFNAGVLGLGGIVIMYTLIVSTMNTAQEGQMLGQKWSSIWVPLRSTAGLALLMPKASGYCVMQIFVMWVVVQGVGAADKVWNAALNYLNRGGVIIQGQVNPSTMLLSGNSAVAKGAAGILAGQVCMLGLQNQLAAQQKAYKDAAEQSSGPCYGTGANPTIKAFCDADAPSGFLSSVNAVTAQSNATQAGGISLMQNGTNAVATTPGSFSVPMPNLSSGSDYAFLNGICGTITWNALPDSQTSSVQQNIPSLTSSDLETAQMSRAIAIQQMYMDLQSVAISMVNNSPQLATTPSSSPVPEGQPPFARTQFGVPLTVNNQVCDPTTNPSACILWGSDQNNSTSPLLTGTEFQNALADYTGIMMPTLNLLAQANNNQSQANARAFIENASLQGWIMAGSYFFDLVNLNQVYYQGQPSATNYDNSSQLTDTTSGLDSNTSFDVVASLSSPFSSQGCSQQFAPLCAWFQGSSTRIDQINALISGALGNTPGINMPSIGKNNPVTVGPMADTVYGYINNASALQLPNQPGLAPLTFLNQFNIDVEVKVTKLQKMKFECGRVWIMFFSFCLGKLLGDIFYNIIFLILYNTFLNVMMQVINTVVVAFITIPLEGIAAMFKSGLEILDAPNVNPVVALANMGAAFINFASNLWINLISVAISASMIPLFGIFIFPLMMMGMPLLFAWLGVMFSVGFLTAYYIPMLPYMIFTFGAFAWMMAVIEAMVAAPIVALGVTHPEGHEAFGKGEQAMMLLMNVFLRPSLMIIGFIAGIALTYVGVWLINTGFDHAIAFIQSGSIVNPLESDQATVGRQATKALYQQQQQQGTGVSGTGGYSDWAGIYAYFFSALIYTSMYMTVVQKSFTLIAMLPDKVLRWIGGQPESYGQETLQWSEETKGKVEKAQESVTRAQAQVTKTASGGIQKILGKSDGASGKGGGSVGGGEES